MVLNPMVDFSNTRAIITKYKHLRDYVEKVTKPTYLDYDLAASYTGKEPSL